MLHGLGVVVDALEDGNCLGSLLLVEHPKQAASRNLREGGFEQRLAFEVAVAVQVVHDEVAW